MKINRNKMNILTAFTLLFTLNSCIGVTEKKDFEQFTKNFNEIILPFSVNDSLAFEDWPSKFLIDSITIKKYDLISKYSHKEYPPKTITDYQCSYFGKYNTEEFKVLLYRTFTTEAGRGNPEIVLATFSSNGLKQDEMIVLWNDNEDPLYSRRICLSILNASNFEIKSVLRKNGFLDKKIVPKSIVEKINHYMIGKDGKIIVGKEIVKDVFKDNNPKIQDDFPQE
jgi:hypothetical protein